jgi:lipopolysaccharide assembly outer membrane protein LptD (OstA)
LKLKSDKNKITEGKTGLTQPVKEESVKNSNFKNMSSLIDNFNLSHSLNFDLSKDTLRNNKLTMGSHTLTLSGSIPLSGSWNLTFGSLGYNFKDKKIPYASIGISRNLHCWEISGNWYPTRGAYLFTIKVIDSPFGDFLKYPVQKQNGDAYGGYR